MITLPHSDAAEQTLLGMVLINNDFYKIVAEQLQPSDFFIPLYAEAYRAIGEIIGERFEATPLSVSERMRGHGASEALFAQFGKIFEAAGMATDVAGPAYIISKHAYHRKIIAAAETLTGAVKDGREEDVALLQKQIAELTQTFSNLSPETPLSQVQKAMQVATNGALMMQTHVPMWDDAFGGLFSGSRYIIAGHGGAGKSALAVNIAWNMAKAGYKVRWLSYEEEPHALWWRVMARETQTPITSFRNGLTERQQALVTERGSDLHKYDFLSFYGLPDVGQMIGACGKCDLIVLDGITSAPAPGADNKVEKAGVVTEYCAKMAAKTGAAVIMLAHVNSDSLKTGASMSGVYGGQAATFDPEGIVDLRWFDDAKTVTAMTVLKNRYGAAGNKYKMVFNGQLQSFSPYHGN